MSFPSSKSNNLIPEKSRLLPPSGGSSSTSSLLKTAGSSSSSTATLKPYGTLSGSTPALVKTTGPGANLTKTLAAARGPLQVSSSVVPAGSKVAGKKRPFPAAPEAPPVAPINLGACEPPTKSGVLSGFSVLIVTPMIGIIVSQVWKENLLRKGAAVFAPPVPAISVSSAPTLTALKDAIESWATYQNVKLGRKLVIVPGDKTTEKSLRDWSIYAGSFIRQPSPSVYYVTGSWIIKILDSNDPIMPTEDNFVNVKFKWLPTIRVIPYVPSEENEEDLEAIPLKAKSILMSELPYSNRENIDRSRVDDWVKSHCESYEEMLRMGDDASRFGLNEKDPFLHCPWSREELVWGFSGKNMDLLRQFPFLEVAIPLVPRSAINNSDLTAGTKANQWWCTRDCKGDAKGAAGDVYNSRVGFEVQYEATSMVRFTNLEGSFPSEPSPFSLGTCVYRSFVPLNHSPLCVTPSSKILGLDIDGTLIKPVDEHLTYCDNANDFQEAFRGAYEMVRSYYRKGFKIVLFTNQAGLLKGQSTITVICNRIKQLAELIGVPLQVFISSGGPIDSYRKPYGGMFVLMISRCNGGLQVDMSKSIFVGDMAGRDQIGSRPKDRSCSDHQFAIVCGLKFKTPEEFFAPVRPQKDGVLRPLGAVKGENFNLHITKPLAKLLPLYRARNKMYNNALDPIRREALIRGLGNLSRLNYTVKTEADADELINLPCIGPRTVEKIKEILKNEGTMLHGSCATLRDLEQEGSGKYLCRAGLMECPYIGPATAKSLANCGIMTLEDVKNMAHLLKEGCRLPSQRLPKLDARIFLHLDILDDLKQRVPRAESEHVLTLIRSIVYEFAPGSMVIMGGSYRRGSTDSSDLDVIISGPKDRSKSAMDILRDLWRKLTDGNYLPRNISKTDYLEHKPPFEEQGSKLHMAVFKDSRDKNSKYRRIDLKICDYRFWAASLHAWTGNTQLNRIMKRYIANLGYSLNDKTLAQNGFKRSSKSGDEPRSTLDNERLIGLVAESEFDLFSFLGLRFIPPTERNVLAIYSEDGEAQQLANKVHGGKNMTDKKKDWESDPLDEEIESTLLGKHNNSDREEYVDNFALLGNHVDDFVPQSFIFFETEEEKRVKQEAIERCKRTTIEALRHVLEAQERSKHG